jgi:hypothetical protein
MSEWQPIETAPLNQRVLLFGPVTSELHDEPGAPMVCTGYRMRPGNACFADPVEYYSVNIEASHWMPLPAPPRDASGEEPTT